MKVAAMRKGERERKKEEEEERKDAPTEKERKRDRIAPVGSGPAAARQVRESPR